jgi:hypothetical protein
MPQTDRQRQRAVDKQKREEEEAKRADLWEKIKKESKQVQKEFKAHEDVTNSFFTLGEKKT